jgi:protein-S-isoprenylcysteine O-methyltransferase Ste14
MAWYNRHPILTGAAIGFAGGSVVPVVGNVVGAITGAIVGPMVIEEEKPKEAAYRAYAMSAEQEADWVAKFKWIGVFIAIAVFALLVVYGMQTESTIVQMDHEWVN